MKKTFSKIMFFSKPHKWMFLSLFACIIITTFSGMIYPYIFGKLVDEVFYNKNINAFLSIMIFYGVVYVFNQTMHFLLNMSWANLMTKFLFSIRKHIFEKVLSYKGIKLSNLKTGDIISRMNSDVEQFMNFIHWNIFYSIGGALKLILSIAFIAYINWYLAIIAVILTPISVYISRKLSKRVKIFYEQISQKSGVLSSWVFEIIKGMQDIKLLCASKNVLLEYFQKSKEIVRIRIKANKVEVYSERIISGISLLSQLFLYIASAIFIINGNLTLGGFTACLSYFGTGIAMFNALTNKANDIAANMTGVERVLNIFEEDSEIINDSKSNFVLTSGNIDFNNVVFSYNDDISVLKSISFNINAGEKVALVGHSGAGKSTIANLILKFYDIQKGQILIDGIDIEEFNLHNLRSQIGIVHQETILFDGSIRYNLTFSDDKSSDGNILQALKQSHLYEFVTSLPDGLDTIIGTEGRALSGGQKQRLAVARIFTKNPKILIFDEATSSLDYEAEQVIKESWAQLCEGRTIVIIAHRLSTIMNADKILVLNDGKVAGYDVHKKLLNTCDIYNQLFKEQYNLQEEGVAANA